MPVPTQVSDLSTTIASNSPAGSDNVFPDLDNHIRALAGMLASVATNSATNGYSNPYLPNAAAAVFNEAGADIDFRAEGDTDTNLLFLDASTDRVGVGTSTPDAKFTVNGVVAVGDGAAATPSLVNTGDLNTGFWFPADDTIAASVGGSEQMRLTSTGLGIGTSSPTRKLQVNSGEAVAARFTRSGGTVANNSLEWFDGTNGWYAGVSGSNFFGIAYNSSGAIDSAALRLDSSGNLGLGVTPSAWRSASKALQIGQGASFWANTANPYAFMSSNAFLNSSSQDIYIVNGHATTYTQQTGQHIWYTAPSGTAGNAISFTQAMTLDASGRLLVGTTTATDRRLSISTNATSVVQEVLAPSTDSATICFADVNTSTAINQRLGSIGNNLGFWTGATERARITSGGDLLVGTVASSSARLYVRGSGTTSATASFEAANSSGATRFYVQDDGTTRFFGSSGSETARITSGGDLLVGGTFGSGFQVFYSNTDGINSRSGQAAGTGRSLYTGWYSATSTTQGTLSFNVTTNGNVTNTNGSYGTISDAKMKTDIVDAGSQWADIKAVRFRKYKMKNDPTGLVQLGVVAQELEQTSPGLVEEHPDRDAEGNDLGTTTKTVKSSVLLMKAAVALQEAMARIEQLESTVTALTARVAALEAKL